MIWNTARHIHVSQASSYMFYEIYDILFMFYS